MSQSNTGRKPSIPNKHIHQRMSYMYQAAHYLAAQSARQQEQERNNSSKAPDAVVKLDCDAQVPPRSSAVELNNVEKSDLVNKPTSTKSGRDPDASSQAYMLSQMIAVARKAQVRLSRDVKRTVCKGCNALLTPGKTAILMVENKSRHGKKPWADVLVVSCNACGATKRYPVGSKPKIKSHEDVSEPSATT